MIRVIRFAVLSLSDNARILLPSAVLEQQKQLQKQGHHLFLLEEVFREKYGPKGTGESGGAHGLEQ